MVLINPASEADEESMRDRMESRRAREKAEKKAKKESGKKRGGEAADFKVPGGIQFNAPFSTVVLPIPINLLGRDSCSYPVIYLITKQTSVH